MIGRARGSNRNAPITYPKIPPSTEATVQIVAFHQADFRSATTMGISITSGGSGKNELSAKLTPARA